MGNTPQGPYGKPPSGQPAPFDPNDFAVAQKNRDVNFRTCEVDPPSPFYVDVDDIWELGTLQFSNSASIRANIRILRPHGGIETVQIPLGGLSAGAAATITRVEREGYVLSANITWETSAPGFGPWFAWLKITRAGTGVPNVARTLIAGYLDNHSTLSWPEHIPQRPAEGAGFIINNSVGNPAAGVDWVFTNPTGARATVMGVFAQLVTSAAAATRTATLKITDGANIAFLVDATATQIASITNQYTGYCGGFAGGSGGTHIYWPLPAPYLLGTGWTIGTVTNNIQAADQWSLIRVATLTLVDTI